MMKAHLLHIYKVLGLLIMVGLFLFFLGYGEKDMACRVGTSLSMMRLSPITSEDKAAEVPSPQKAEISVIEASCDVAEESRQSPPCEEAVVEIALDEIVSDKVSYSGIVPVSAWQIEESKIKKLKAGDTLVLPLGGIEYPVYIAKTSQMGRSRVITGIYEDEGSNYPVVITVGKQTTFVSFQTPNGGYQSTLIASEGYVYSNASTEDAYMDKHHSDAVTVTSNRDLDIISR